MHDVDRRHRAFYDAEAPARADRPLDPDRLRVRDDLVRRLRAAGVERVADVMTVETWGRYPDGGHYQWVVARLH